MNYYGSTVSYISVKAVLKRCSAARLPRFGILGRLAMLVTLGVLAGCVPYTRSFERLSFPDHEVEYARESCNGSIGAPIWVAFDYHGIRISASLDQWRMGSFKVMKVEVPEGREFSLSEFDVVLVSVKEGKYSKTVMPLKDTIEGLGPIQSARMRTVSYEPITTTFKGSTNKLVSFWGKEKESHASFYFFAQTVSRIGDRGQITLPTFVIDGVSYPGPALIFRRDRFFGTASLNC